MFGLVEESNPLYSGLDIVLLCCPTVIHKTDNLVLVHLFGSTVPPPLLLCITDICSKPLTVSSRQCTPNEVSLTFALYGSDYNPSPSDTASDVSPPESTS